MNAHASPPANALDVDDARPDAGEPVDDAAAADEQRTSAAKRRWRPARTFLVADLTAGERRIFLALLIVVSALPLFSAAIVLTQGWRPSGDNALIGLRVHDVLTGHFPLIGQPTTGENFGSGIPTSHPGPIEFYLVAPFAALLGPVVGLAMGAALINTAAFVAVGWLSFRRGGLGLMFLASLVAVAMARSLGGNILHDPVSSNVGSVVALALLFAVWSIVAGDLRTVPVFVMLGSFALQDHLTYLGTGAPLVLLALVLGGWWYRQTRRRSKAEWLRSRMLIGLGVGLVLWLPVFYDEIFGDHNLTAILKTFTGKRTAGEGIVFALGRVAEAFAPVPVFARRIGPLGYLHKPAPHEWVLGYLVLGAIVALGIHFYRQRRTDMTALALVTVVASAAGAYTALKLPVGAGIQASNLRWMWTVSAFAWMALIWMIWAVLPAFARDVVRAPALVAGACAMALAVLAVLGTVSLDEDRDGSTAQATTELVNRVKGQLPEGTYRVKYAGGPVVVSVGPALVHDIDHRGDRIYMDIGPFTRAYGRHRAFDDQKVDGTLFVTAEAVTAYPKGTRLLGRQSFRVNRTDKDLLTIRVYLVDGSVSSLPGASS